MKSIQAGLSPTFPIETWEDDEFEFLGIEDEEVRVELQQRPCYSDLRFTNTAAAKAQEFKNEGLRLKAIDEDRPMMCYHDVAWANAPEADEDELSPEDDQLGIQHGATESYKRTGRKAKNKGNSRVASQLGCLILAPT